MDLLEIITNLADAFHLIDQSKSIKKKFDPVLVSTKKDRQWTSH